MALSPKKQEAWERACGNVRGEDLSSLLVDLVDIASPTGEEAELAACVVRRLCAEGIEAHEQAVDGRQVNAVATLRGRGAAPSLLLYAPVDTVTSGSREEDIPWAANTLLPELKAKAKVFDGHISGLGAHNPKGHAACAVAAFEALHRSGLRLDGDVLLGLGSGGMPTNPRPQSGNKAGHGNGCRFMIMNGPKPDCAIIAKSGWSISWEEVGLAWYEVRVKGTHTYVGSRHLMPYSNAISNAGLIIKGLENWFPIYSEKHRSGLVCPQGVVSWIEGGWSRMPAFTPAECRFRFDLRLSPRTDIAEADREIDGILTELAEEAGLEVSWQRLVAIPGTSTDPEDPVIQKSIDAWQAVDGGSHEPMSVMSGATDANILRALGIPTARVGLPKAAISDGDFQKGMNTVRIEDMERLTKLLLHAAIDIAIAD